MSPDDIRRAAADLLAAMTETEVRQFIADARGQEHDDERLREKLLAAVGRRPTLALVRDAEPEPTAEIPAIALNDDESLKAIIHRAFRAPVGKITNL